MVMMSVDLDLLPVLDLRITAAYLLADSRIAPATEESTTSPGPGAAVVVEPAPGVHGSVRIVTMAESSRHRGERHLDGDELVCLVAGDAAVEVLKEAGGATVTALEPGVAAIVPSGTWHRVVIHAPSQLLFVTLGRAEVRRPNRKSTER
jgi:quercetin dioxygenase-like cupin family protein